MFKNVTFRFEASDLNTAPRWYNHKREGRKTKTLLHELINIT